jgi:thiamine transport system substrate-binding protein
VLAAGDAGAMTNQAVLTKDNPLADVLFGIDDTFLARGLGAGIFLPYSSPGLERVDAELDLDPEHRVTPIDYGDVCLNYDKEAFSVTPPPSTLDDLTDPVYANQLVVEDPATSSPGLAFLLATIDRYGDGWPAYWSALAANGVLVAPGWTEAYYTEFSGGAGEGDRPLVVSYASSPPAEVVFSETPLLTAPTGVIIDGCYRQIEFAGVLNGSDHGEEAGQLIDFMLGRDFQESIPLTWFVYPANQDAVLPAVFVDNTARPQHPVQMDPAAVEAGRRGWLETWQELLA